MERVRQAGGRLWNITCGYGSLSKYPGVGGGGVLWVTWLVMRGSMLWICTGSEKRGQATATSYCCSLRSTPKRPCYHPSPPQYASAANLTAPLASFPAATKRAPLKLPVLDIQTEFTSRFLFWIYFLLDSLSAVFFRWAELFKISNFITSLLTIWFILHSQTHFILWIFPLPICVYIVFIFLGSLLWKSLGWQCLPWVGD